MNKSELEENPVLTSFNVQDLNKNPKLPYDDGSFDFITNAVSVDYLAKPLEVCGGLVVLSWRLKATTVIPRCSLATL